LTQDAAFAATADATKSGKLDAELSQT